MVSSTDRASLRGPRPPIKSSVSGRHKPEVGASGLIRTSGTLAWTVVIGAAIVTVLGFLGWTYAVNHPVAVGAEGVAALILRSAPDTDPYQGYFCAGAVVDEVHILTAAHCVDRVPPERIDVLVGADNLCSGARVTGERIPVLAALIHPLYEPMTGRNDIALLTLASPSSSTTLRDRWPPPGTTATAYGWGSRETGGPPSCTIRSVNFGIPLQGECPDLLSASSRPFDAETMMCGVSQATESLCYGDSGAPLLIRDESGQAWLLGVLSWSPTCTGAAAFARANHEKLDGR